jgi:hypothetical protein
MPRGTASEIGSKTVNRNGYEQVKTEDGWVGTHVLMMESTLGRKLKGSERVRFIDGDRSNLVIGNLEIYYLKSGSTRRKLAAVKDRIRELQAERDYLEAILDDIETTN